MTDAAQLATVQVPTLADKEDAYAAAVIGAITDTATRMGAPDKRAAMVALAYTVGYLMHDLDPKDRLALRGEFIDRMDADAAAFANARFLAKASPAGRG